MTYDPKAAGAQCDRCPLARDRRGPPVPGEFKSSAVVLVVGEAPAKNEVEKQRPFMGPSGRVLEEALVENGLSRADISLTNVICCRLPEKKGDKSEMQAYLAQCKKKGEPSPIECCAPRLKAELSAYSYVIPMGDFAAKQVLGVNKGIMTLRGAPFERESALILPTVHPAMTLPGRKPALKWVFQHDVGRAFRYFTGGLKWDEYSYLVYPTVQDALDWMDWVEETHPWIAHDVETNSKYPLRACMRCIGLSTLNEAMTIPLLSVDGRHRFYSQADETKILARFKRLMKSNILWYGWNSGWYDRITLEELFGHWVRRHQDGLMGHRSAWPQLGHDLGTAGTTLTDVTNWKADESGHKISKTDIEDFQKEMKGLTQRGVQPFHWDYYWNEACAATFGRAPGKTEPMEIDPAELAGPAPEGWDKDLWRVRQISHEILKRDATLFKYNSKDNIVTARVKAPIEIEVSMRAQDAPLTRYPDITIPQLAAHCQEVCVGLHRVGVYIDQERRQRAESWLQAWTHSMRQELEEKVRKWGRFGKAKSDLEAEGVDGTAEFEAGAYDIGDEPSGFNPNSTKHMADLLYERMKLVPKEFTPTGDPSSNDKALRRHLIEDNLPPEIEDIFYLIRKDRKVRNKWLGTYVAPFSPNPLKGKSKLYPDGRVRAQWNGHGTLVWRYSASDPGLQTIPGDIKAMYTAAPGHILAGADMDQIHLRIIAALWGIVRYQEVFAMGGDPHAMSAFVIFGEEFKQAKGFPGGVWKGEVFIPNGQGKWSGQAKNLRQIAKTFIYAFAYGAELDTIYQVLIKAEDAFGRLVFKEKPGAKQTFRSKVEAMRAKTLAGMPEFEAGWAMEMELAVSNGQMTGEPPWLADPLAGIRRDFLGGLGDAAEKNEVRNFRVLTTEAVIMHMRERELLAEMPFQKYGPGTGMIIQVHDSISIELPRLRGMTLEESGKWGADFVADKLTSKIPGWEHVPFTASGTFGHTLLEA